MGNDSDEFKRMLGEKLMAFSDELNEEIADLTHKKLALDDAWGVWDADALYSIGAITESEANRIRMEQGECINCGEKDAFEDGAALRCLACGADKEGELPSTQAPTATLLAEFDEAVAPLLERARD